MRVSILLNAGRKNGYFGGGFARSTVSTSGCACWSSFDDIHIYFLLRVPARHWVDHAREQQENDKCWSKTSGGCRHYAIGNQTVTVAFSAWSQWSLDVS
jgi:hypothetical protein